MNGDGQLTANELFVYVANPDGPQPNCGFTTFGDLQVWTLNDANSDGDALDTDERYRSMVHPTGCFNRGLELVPAGGFAASRYNRSGVLSVGGGGCRLQGSLVEMDFTSARVEEGARGTPFAGNDRFQLVISGLNSGNAVAIGIAPAKLPVPIVSGGCNIWILPILVAGGLTANAQGEAILPVAIPANTPPGSAFVQALAFVGGGVISEVIEIRVN